MKSIHEFEIKNMLRMANEARDRAYAPYSKFKVGACLKGASGAYFMGCNIENAAFTPTVCAERVAMFKAVYEGEREFDAIAIMSDSDHFALPCGVCRQVLAEFCDQDMPIICAKRSGEYKVLPMEALLPEPFTAEDIHHDGD